MEHPDANSPVISENDASFSPYVYRPLQEHEFTRALLLHPSVLPEAPLRCDLSYVDMGEDFGQCEAISYAWGLPELTSSLVRGPNQDMIRITPSLD